MTDHVLTRGRIAARVNPQRGAVISSITIDGVEVLAQMPWAPEPLPVLPDEPAWVGAWSGGWNVLLPNAGQASHATPTPQGFHGSASVSPWALVHHTDQEVHLTWSEGGLLCSRTVALEGPEVRATSTLRNVGDAVWPIVVTEHAILGAALLTQPAHLVIEDPAILNLLAYDGRPTREPEQPWPGDRWNVVDSASHARVAAARGIGERGVRVDSGDLSVQITWSTGTLPYAWIWQEQGVSPEPPWNGQVHALGIEPSTCPHGAGVDSAMADGTAVLLSPGQSFTWWAALSVHRDRKGDLSNG